MIKHCVGPFIYDDQDRIFLMRSSKWGSNWLIPGGKIEEGETDIQALHREVREELGIGIDRVVFYLESWKEPSADFIKKDVRFHFLTYHAHALSTDITPNHEISEWGWYAPETAWQMQLLDATRDSMLEYVRLRHPVLYERIKPREMGAAIVIKDGKLLTIYNTKHGSARIEPPGGKKEPFETIEDCICRELREEIGCQVTLDGLFAIKLTYSPEGSFRVHMYRATLQGEPCNAESTKHKELRWHTVQELKQLPNVVPNLQAILPQLEHEMK